MSIAIVTDSTADIPTYLLESLHIHVVPNLVIIGGQSLEDGRGISRREFYERLPLMADAAAELSGIYNAATTAGQTFGDRVCVVDSGQVSMGLGFQVIEAAEAALRGDPLPAILNNLQDLRSRLRVVAMLDTLEYIRRGGRVSWTKARLGNLLRVKPFLEVKEGRVISLGEVRTRSKGILRLKEILRESGPLVRLAVLHSNAETDARQFLEDINPETHLQPLIVNVTTVIGTHVGPNGLGFAIVIE
jgi:DegV family protein with EDD domain